MSLEVEESGIVGRFSKKGKTANRRTRALQSNTVDGKFEVPCNPRSQPWSKTAHVFGWWIKMVGDFHVVEDHCASSPATQPSQDQGLDRHCQNHKRSELVVLVWMLVSMVLNTALCIVNSVFTPLLSGDDRADLLSRCSHA